MGRKNIFFNHFILFIGDTPYASQNISLETVDCLVMLLYLYLSIWIWNFV